MLPAPRSHLPGGEHAEDVASEEAAGHPEGQPGHMGGRGAAPRARPRRHGQQQRRRRRQAGSRVPPVRADQEGEGAQGAREQEVRGNIFVWPR